MPTSFLFSQSAIIFSQLISLLDISWKTSAFELYPCITSDSSKLSFPELFQPWQTGLGPPVRCRLLEQTSSKLKQSNKLAACSNRARFVASGSEAFSFEFDGFGGWNNCAGKRHQEWHKSNWKVLENVNIFN